MAISTLPQQEAVGRIKNDLSAYLGKTIKMSTIKSRGMLWECEGILEQVYPNLFVIEIEDKNEFRKISYSYADVLTKTIKLVCGETGQDLFPWLPDRF